jgi:hypothetical protein
MYGVSSIPMAHHGLSRGEPAVTESTLTIPERSGGDARAVSRELMDSRGMRGELMDIKQTEGGFRFRIARPGAVYDVDYRRQSSLAKIRTEVAGPLNIAIRLHHISGLWQDYWLKRVWGAYLGISSAALIVLGVTGLYLWFKTYRERTIGLILLALNLIYSVTLMIWIRMG